MPSKMDRDSVAMRAAAAWCRMAQKEGGGIPMMSNISVEEVGDKTYVTWRESGALVGCFRVRNDGKLKRLRRPPTAIAAGAA